MKRTPSLAVLSHRSFRFFAPPAIAALVAAAVVSFAGPARADTTCTHDSDCGKGFTCQVTSASACSDIACAPNEVCPPVDCTPTTYSTCVPGPCSTDSDCASGMVCYEQPVDCAVEASPPCPAGENCPAVDASPVCSGSSKTCVPKYDLPCTADADCGDNFTCVQDQACGCSGSAGSGTGTDVAPPAATNEPTSAPDDPAPEPAVDGGTPASPSCSCTPQSTRHCEAKTIDCNAASDCPSQWTCEVSPSSVSGCTVDPSSDGAPCTPVATSAPSVCEPPYYGGVPGTGSLDSNGAAPTASGAGNAGGTAGGTASQGASGSSGAASDQGGCAIGSGPAGAEGGVWAALFGFAALLRLRGGQAGKRRGRTA